MRSDQSYSYDNSEIEKRKSVRNDIVVSLSAASDRHENFQIKLTNISINGASFETDVLLNKGERIQILISPGSALDAKIIWKRNNVFGCFFTEPLMGEALAYATGPEWSGSQIFAEVVTPRPFVATDPLPVRLKKLRQTIGLTLGEIARALSVSKPTVWAWEKGQAKPAPHRFNAISQFFCIDPSELCSIEYHRDPQSLDYLLLEKFREQIAQAWGVPPTCVRISIEI